MRLSVFIAEDELFGREEIKHQLSVYNEVVLVGEAANGIDAVKSIKELRPDLIFLDVEMPGLKGIEVMDSISTIEDYKPFIIIISAYDQYALKAFEHDVVDYLLKPIDTKRFATSMSRVLRYFDAKKVNRISAKKGNRIFLIPVEDISCVAVEDTIVYIHSNGNAYSTTYRTLEEVEKELDSTNFFRTHRSFIVNLKKIREIKHEENGGMNLKVDGVENIDVPVSRSKAKELKTIFKI